MITVGLSDRTFGIILGLLAWYGLQATVTVYVLEADVVRARQLWPRSLTLPPLTAADQRFLTHSTHAETRRPNSTSPSTSAPKSTAPREPK